MPVTVTNRPEPLSSAEFSVPDFRRVALVAARQEQVAEWLRGQKLDALLITRAENFAWFTAGGSNVRGFTDEKTAVLLVTADARVVATNNVDSQEVFDRQLHGLGFQLKERPWHEHRANLIGDLCRGRKVGSDTAGLATDADAGPWLANRRRHLDPFEHARLRDLGRVVAHAVEATARAAKPGVVEREVAGELAHRLLKRGVDPVRLQALGDGRARTYPHGGYGSDACRGWLTVAATGRRDGLHVAAARTVVFEPVDDRVRDAHRRALAMQTTGMAFSRGGWEWSETWRRVRRIYEKFDRVDEWRLSEQADLIGYRPTESRLVNGSGEKFTAGTPVYWHPAVGSCPTGDTILPGEEGYELLTPSQNWPEIGISVKGVTMPRPDVLIRG
ncbi:MAG: M24 family metallopeptidase [Planctomycetota bacterium]